MIPIKRSQETRGQVTYSKVFLHPGAEAHAKALALTRGVEWGTLDLAGRAEMVSEKYISCFYSNLFFGREG